MKNKSLTEKEWIVLKHFIEKESQAIQKWFSNKKIKPEPQQHFITYQSKIVLDLGNISKPTAGKACKKFLKIGLFDSIKKHPNFKGGETDFYSLKSDLQTIRKIVKLVMEMCETSVEIIQIIGNYYFMYNVNESLVKEVLYEKQVKISRIFSVFECDINNANTISKKYLNYSDNEFNESIKSGIYKYEKIQKRNEKDYIEDIHHVCNEFLVDYNDKSFDLVKFYDSDYRLVSSLQKPDYTNFNTKSLLTPISINLIFPVFKDDLSHNEVIEEIQNVNESVLQEYPSLKDFSSGIKNHYEIIQYHKLILPILSLIQSSTKALDEFLNGDWKTFVLNLYYYDDCGNCDFFNELFIVTINDISNTLQIPKNSIVETVFSRAFPFKSLTNSINPHTYEYLSRAYHDSISFEEMAKMQYSSLTIRLKNLYEIYFNMNFVASDEPKNDSSIRVSNFIKMSYEIEFCLLTKNNIMDSKGLILKLKNEKSPLHTHIRSKLSHPIQNLLKYYECENEPSVNFQKMIVDDLNYALLRGDLYDEKLFRNIISPKEIENNLMTIVDLSNTNDFFKNNFSNMLNIDSHKHTIIVQQGRYLLEKAFSDEIEQHYTELILRKNVTN